VVDTLGHGRSACVVCAILVALGIAETWKDAENIIRERRKIKMNALHRKTLEGWSNHRVSQKKGKLTVLLCDVKACLKYHETAHLFSPG